MISLFFGDPLHPKPNANNKKTMYILLRLLVTHSDTSRRLLGATPGNPILDERARLMLLWLVVVVMMMYMDMKRGVTKEKGKLFCDMLCSGIMPS